MSVTMYLYTRTALGSTVGQPGLAACDPGPASAMTKARILDTVKCELQRTFTNPTDPRLFLRRRRLRELFNNVPAPDVKDLFDQLRQQTDPLAQLFRSRLARPTRQELLSILFFAEYDLRFEPASASGVAANPRMSPIQRAERINDVRDLTSTPGPPPRPLLRIRRDERAAFALAGLVAPSAPVPPSLRPATERLAKAQCDLFCEFFPDGSGGINFDDFEHSFEQFANGELRDPRVRGKREPNGGFYFYFAEFAFLCIDSGMDVATWTRLLRIFVMTQEIFMHIYRPAPFLAAPPSVPTAVPAAGAPVGGRGLDQRRHPVSRAIVTPGYTDENFNSRGQSGAARKDALRRIYRPMTLAGLRSAARDNLLRALRLP